MLLRGIGSSEQSHRSPLREWVRTEPYLWARAGTASVKKVEAEQHKTDDEDNRGHEPPMETASYPRELHHPLARSADPSDLRPCTPL